MCILIDYNGLATGQECGKDMLTVGSIGQTSWVYHAAVCIK